MGFIRLDQMTKATFLPTATSKKITRNCASTQGFTTIDQEEASQY